MKTMKLPGSPKTISRAFLGTMIVGLNNYAESAALLDSALRHGLNALDLAYVYGGGDTERAVGRWMAERGNREDVFILTKGAHPDANGPKVNPKAITVDLTESLSRLQISYVDAYLLHRDDLSVPVGPIVEVLNEHHAAGCIRAFGGSNWTHQRIAEANAYAAAHNLVPFTISSPYFGLCEQVDNPWGPGCVSISGVQGADARAYYADNDILVLAYSSLGRGMLSGRVTRDNYKDLLDGAALTAYAHEVNFVRLDRAREMAAEKGISVPQLGLAYIMAQPLLIAPIVGAASEQEIMENVAALDIKLTAQECVWLEHGV